MFHCRIYLFPGLKSIITFNSRDKLPETKIWDFSKRCRTMIPSWLWTVALHASIGQVLLISFMASPLWYPHSSHFCVFLLVSKLHKKDSKVFLYGNKKWKWTKMFGELSTKNNKKNPTKFAWWDDLNSCA